MKGAPVGQGWHKTLYNRFIRWSRKGVFNRIFSALAGQGARSQRIMIVATHIKAYRRVAGLFKKGIFPAASAVQKTAWTRNCVQSAIRTESRYACFCQEDRWVATKKQLSCCRFRLIHRHSLPTGVMTQTNSGKRCLTETSRSVFLQ